MNRPIDKAKSDAALQFAMDTIRRIPRDDPEALEAHITGVLIVFWGALWGSFGTDYARDFIEAQLRGMQAGVGRETFTEPSTH